MNYSTKPNEVTPKMGEVWFVKFPYAENASILKPRPVIVLAENNYEFKVASLRKPKKKYLSVKVISKKKRKYDPFDTVIVKWKEAGLNRESVARISKTINIPDNQFIKKLGLAQESDLENILTKFIEYNGI